MVNPLGGCSASCVPADAAGYAQLTEAAAGAPPGPRLLAVEGRAPTEGPAARGRRRPAGDRGRRPRRQDAARAASPTAPRGPRRPARATRPHPAPARGRHPRGPADRPGHLRAEPAPGPPPRTPSAPCSPPPPRTCAPPSAAPHRRQVTADRAWTPPPAGTRPGRPARRPAPPRRPHRQPRRRPRRQPPRPPRPRRRVDPRPAAVPAPAGHRRPGRSPRPPRPGPLRGRVRRPHRTAPLPASTAAAPATACPAPATRPGAALHIIAIARLRSPAPTIAYAARRRTRARPPARSAAGVESVSESGHLFGIPAGRLVCLRPPTAQTRRMKP